MDPEETECHHMGTPLGSCTTGTAAGGDATAIKHDRHVVGSFRLTGLSGDYCSTEMKALYMKTEKNKISKDNNEFEMEASAFL